MLLGGGVGNRDIHINRNNFAPNKMFWVIIVAKELDKTTIAKHFGLDPPTPPSPKSMSIN